MEQNEQEILALFAEMEELHPELGEVINLQYDLLAARRAIRARVSLPEYTEAELRGRVAKGVPMLRPQEMALDWEVFTGLFRKACEVTARHRPDLAPELERLSVLPDLEPDRLELITTEYLGSDRLTTGENEISTDADNTEAGQLLIFVLNHSLRPFLKAYARGFGPMLRERLGVDWDKRWQRGYCPICSAEPDLAYLDAESGSRLLVCARCDTAWLYPRVKCPFCSTIDPAQLSYYGTDDNKHRIYVCNNCRRYLKAIDQRQIGRPLVFPVERVLTIDLDAAARQKGYR